MPSYTMCSRYFLCFRRSPAAAINTPHANNFLSSRLGVSKGDVVLILAPNSLLFPVSFLALVSLGAVPTTVNPLYTFPEISKQAIDSRCRVAITVPDLWPKVAPLRLPTVVLDSPSPGGPSPSSLRPAPVAPVISYSDHVAGFSESDFSPPPVKQSDTATLLYSSGTTGASKGVVLTHRNFISTAVMITVDQDAGGESPNAFLCFLPMFHIFGLSVITFAKLSRGNTVVACKGKLNLFKMLLLLELSGSRYDFEEGERICNP